MHYTLTLIVGKSFTGKTARMFYELRRFPRVVVVDPKCGQLVSLRYDHLWTEFSRGRFVGTIVPDYFSSRLSDSFRCIVHIRHQFKEQLDALSFLLLRVKNLAFAVDELGLFCPPGPAGVLPRSLTALIVSGRHEGISFFATVQRPSMIHKTILSQATRMLVYRVTEENDLDCLRNYVSSEFIGALPFLPDHACLDWADGRDPFFDYSYRNRLGHLLPKSGETPLFVGQNRLRARKGKT